MEAKLKLIDKQEINKEIKTKYDYVFSLETEGLYLIEIIASAKAWWQNFKSIRSFFKDDDIVLFLDNKEITTTKGIKKDALSAWNGNELKGLFKTMVLATNLKKGKHVISLVPDQSPYLKSIIVSRVEDNSYIPYIPTSNGTAEKCSGRPWLSFVLINLFINKLSVSANVDKRGRDDDDIKLIINGEIQKNDNNKSHRDWYWCGKILKGKEKSFSLKVNSKKEQYDVDLWADYTPHLHMIEVEVKIEANNSKKIPTVDNPKWTGSFQDDSDEMLLARLIFGEENNEPYEAKLWAAWSVINRTEANSWWPKTIKEVILQEDQYDPFKTTNDVYKKIIDPLGYKTVGPTDKKSWYECYQIAQDVVARKIINPTTATHFFGVGITQGWYEKNVVPKGKFLKRIGNTYFYWSPN